MPSAVPCELWIRKAKIFRMISLSLSLPATHTSTSNSGGLSSLSWLPPTQGWVGGGDILQEVEFSLFCSNPGKMQEKFQRQGIEEESWGPGRAPSIPLAGSTSHSPSAQVPPPILLQGSWGRTATLKVADTTVLCPDLWAVPAHAEPATHRERAVLQARVPETPPRSPCFNVCSASFLREAKGSLSSWGLWSHGKNSSNFIICFLVKAVVFFFSFWDLFILKRDHELGEQMERETECQADSTLSSEPEVEAQPHDHEIRIGAYTKSWALNWLHHLGAPKKPLFL